MCISLFRRPPNRGLAMATYRPADVDTLDVLRWYVWGWGNYTDARYTPMVRDWLPVAGKTPPQYLLLGNEPNYWEPWGATFNPDGAAWWCKAFELQYPETTMVVGNVSQHDHFGDGQDGVWWLEQFLATYEELWDVPFSGILGCHLYVDADLDYAEYELQRYRDVYDGPMWLTELGMAVNPAQPKAFRKLCKMASERFDMVFAYTNMQDGGPSSLPFDMDLCNEDGSLTAIGKVWANG